MRIMRPLECKKKIQINRELTAGENGDTTDGSDKIYEDRSKDGEFPKKAPLNEFPHSKDIPQPPPELKNSRNVLLDLTDVDGFSHVKKRGSTSKGLRKKIPDKKPRQIKKPSAAQRSWKTSYSGPSCCRCRSRSRKSSISASNRWRSITSSSSSHRLCTSHYRCSSGSSRRCKCNNSSSSSHHCTCSSHSGCSNSMVELVFFLCSSSSPNLSATFCSSSSPNLSATWRTWWEWQLVSFNSKEVQADAISFQWCLPCWTTPQWPWVVVNTLRGVSEVVVVDCMAPNYCGAPKYLGRTKFTMWSSFVCLEKKKMSAYIWSLHGVLGVGGWGRVMVCIGPNNHWCLQKWFKKTVFPQPNGWHVFLAEAKNI